MPTSAGKKKTRMATARSGSTTLKRRAVHAEREWQRHVLDLQFFIVRRHELNAPLFPYTTLFRSSLDQYLREISQYPLITREEEVTLAQRIKQQDPLRECDLFLAREDRKSTRQNSSHSQISYADFCRKKKNENGNGTIRIDNAQTQGGAC